MILRKIVFPSILLIWTVPALSAETLDSLVSKVNQRIATDGLPLIKLQKETVVDWFNDYLSFGMVKEDRNPIFDGLKAGVLIDPYSIEIDLRENIPVPDIKPLIVFKGKNFSMPIVEGTRYIFYSDFARNACKPAGTCIEEYRGTPSETAQIFPISVPVKITESSAPGVCLAPPGCVHDILDIEIEISKTNIADVVNYFNGLDKSMLKVNLDAALGAEARKWISLNRVFPGWLGLKTNTFPVDGDNEVCHGPARQFFNSALMNGTYDRSTEPVAVLLKDYYCPVADNNEPNFGDYLYVPGRHSGRFVMKDPASNRWVAFSVQSGGGSAFRFWWVDEDFSGHPFDRKPLPDFRVRFVDVWRRCR